MKTKPILMNMALIAITCTFLSCGPLIFKANFDADTVGSMPNPNPPGDPSGDRIDALPLGLTVINSSIFGSKALQFVSTAALGEGGSASLYSKSVDTSNKFLNCGFSIYEKNTTSGRRSDFLIFFGGWPPNGRENTSGFVIRLGNGKIMISDGSYADNPEDWYDFEEIGTFSTDEKLIFFAGLNRDTMTYSLLVIREDSNLNINLENLPIGNPEFWGKPTYGLGMRFHIDAYGSNEAFVVDDVTMNKERMRE